MSQATIVSIVPFPIAEFKPGIYPGFFEIPASKSELPEVLTIGDSVYHVEVDENRLITINCNAHEMARSIVHDYVMSNLEYSVEDDAAPGIFWEPGKFSQSDIILKFSNKLEQLKNTQKNWFVKLVRLADDDWEKTRQHKFISDIQRHAARSLKLERPWLINLAVPPSTEGLIKCPACAFVLPSIAIVCQACRCIINIDKYKTLQFATEKV